MIGETADLIPIRNQGLQVLESFTYPLPPNLYQEWCIGKKSSDPYNNIFRLLTQQKYTQMPVMSQQIQLAMIKNLFSYKGNPSWFMHWCIQLQLSSGDLKDVQNRAPKLHAVEGRFIPELQCFADHWHCLDVPEVSGWCWERGQELCSHLLCSEILAYGLLCLETPIGCTHPDLTMAHLLQPLASFLCSESFLQSCPLAEVKPPTPKTHPHQHPYKSSLISLCACHVT